MVLKGIFRGVIAMLMVSVLSTSYAQNNHGHDHEHGTAAAHTEQTDGHGGEKGKEKFNPTPVIMHHISDGHGWHILDYKDDAGVEHAVSIPLPVILFTDGNLDVFMSSEFHHGHADVVRGDRTYRMEHGHITELSGKHPLDFSITKNVASMLLCMLLLILVFSSVAGNYKKNAGAPKGLAAFLEPIIVFIRDDVAIPNIGEKKYRKFMSFLLTAFFFIWFNNLLGLIPIFPGGANLTGNIAVTMVLAAFTLVITNVSGNKAYWGHVFAPPGVPLWLLPIMIPVEIIGVLSKPFALMIRLFANITAGHIIILSLVSLIFIFETVMISPVSVAFVLFMNVMELLVALLQAYIFTLLSALFIGQAVQDHH